MPLFGPSASASSQKVLVLCSSCCEPDHKYQLQRWISLPFCSQVYSLLPPHHHHHIQRWRFLCVPTLKIKVLRWVFLTRRNHQRCSWTATFFKRHRSEVNTLKCCKELKYGGNIRAAYIQKWKLPPARLGVDQQLQLASPLDSRVTTVRLVFCFPMEMCDEGMTRCETKVALPPPPLTPT